MTGFKDKRNEEIGHYGQTLINNVSYLNEIKVFLLKNQHYLILQLLNQNGYFQFYSALFLIKHLTCQGYFYF